MSLDVHLTGPITEKKCICQCGNEHTHEVQEEFFSANITHNLGQMAAEAGIYNALWHPKRIGINKAKQLIKPLRDGLELMKANPKRFEIHNAPNSWGTYKDFVPWIERYLAACEANPNADVAADV